MVDLAGPNDTPETARDLGVLEYDEDFFTANVAASDSGDLLSDPVDFFKVTVADNIKSLSFNIRFTSGPSTQYEDFWQVAAFSIPGVSEYTGIYRSGGTLDGVRRIDSFAEGSLPHSIVFDVSGGELVFAVLASAAVEGDPNGPIEDLFPTVGYSFGLSVHEADEPAPSRNPDNVPTEGADTIIFGDTDDFLFGAGGNDLIDGGAGDDRLEGGAGSDRLIGGTGADVAVFSNPAEQYSILYGPDVQVFDRSGTDGIDIIDGIEVLEFEGEKTFNFHKHDSISSLSEEEFTEFTEMYIAYFNRAPDAVGLTFWADAYATGTPLQEIAKLFAASDEAQELFPQDSSADDFVSSVYANVLGRVPDGDGFRFWTDVLEAGDLDRGEFVLSVLGGARAAPPPDASAEFIAQQRADQEYLDGKTDLGLYFGVIKGMSDVPNAIDVMEFYDGSETGTSNAKDAVDAAFINASSVGPEGEFLLQLTGIIDDPFV